MNELPRTNSTKAIDKLILYILAITVTSTCDLACGGKGQPKVTTSGATSGGNSGGNSGGSSGSTLEAATNVVAVPDGPRAIRLSWIDNAKSEVGYRVLRNGIVAATLSENANSFVDLNLFPDVSYTYSVEAFDSLSQVASASATSTTVHSQPHAWSTCKVKAYGSPTGTPGSYWARSSSSNTLSSFMRIDRYSGDVNFGDSFYFGCRQRWDVHTFSGKKYAAAVVNDPETIVYDSTSTSNLKVYWIDGSLRKTYHGARLKVILKYLDGRYFMTVTFTPADPDTELTGETELCKDVELTQTPMEISYD